MPVLHARASVWHQQSGSPEEAIGHAHAAADTTRTVDLIAAYWRAYAAAGRTTDVAEWLNRVGREQIAASPVAVHCAAWLAALSGQHSSARKWLALLETSQHNRPLPDGAVCVEFSAALLRGIFAYGGLQAALESAAKAARLIDDPASAWHATAQAVYGWNLYQAGLPEQARTALRDALAADADAPFARVLALTAMSLMAADDGLTARAWTLARQAGRQLTEGGPRRAPEAALAHLALGCVLASQAQAADARRELELSLRIHSQCHWPNPWGAVETKLRLAQVLLDLGDHDTATGMLDDIGDVLRALPDGTKALQARLARLQQRRPAHRAHLQLGSPSQNAS